MNDDESQKNVCGIRTTVQYSFIDPKLRSQDLLHSTRSLIKSSKGEEVDPMLLVTTGN